MLYFEVPKLRGLRPTIAASVGLRPKKRYIIYMTDMIIFQRFRPHWGLSSAEERKQERNYSVW